MGRTGSSHMGSAVDECKEKPENWCVHHVHICVRCPEGARPRPHTAVQGGDAEGAARSWRKEIILHHCAPLERVRDPASTGRAWRRSAAGFNIHPAHADSYLW